MNKPQFGHPIEIAVGQVWFNPARGNCLKVERVYPQSEKADCLSWRPNGECGSKPQTVCYATLRSYRLVSAITLEFADGGRRVWEVGGGG